MNSIIAQKGLRALSYLLPKTAGELAIKLFATPRRIARPQWEQKLAARGTSGRVGPGEKLATLRWGEPKAPAILLVHGWAGRGTQLGFLVEPLLSLGYQVIALDAPAHGDSRGRMTNVASFASAIEAVAVTLPNLEFAGVVAHSLGALAMLVALSRGLRCRAAVAVAAPAEVSWIVANFCRRVGLSSRAAKAFRKELADWSGLELENVSAAKLAPGLRVPALIVHDPEDQDVPYENAEAFTEYWPGAKLCSIENVGHRKILKSDVFLKAVAEFLGPAR